MSQLKLIRKLLWVVYGVVVVGAVSAIDWSGTSEVRPLLLKIGKAAGLTAFVILAFQVLLTCRSKILDRIFAIDRITDFHKRMGMIVLCLLLAHVTLIIVGTNHPALLSMETSWRVNLGKAALGLALLTVTLAVAFRAFGIDYNIWRASHKSALAIVLLVFLHSYFIGAELRHTNVRIFWWILLLGAVTATGYRNLFIPLVKRKAYHVKSITPQIYNTYTLTLGPAKTPIADYRPGQFIFLKLKRPGRKSETHPFTLSSAPIRDHALTVTIKQCGDFTDTIDQTKTSDMALVEGPYGQFSFMNHPNRPLLLIAGGIGITPLISMMRYLRDTHDLREVILLYGNRTRKDIVFEAELAKLPEHFRVFHVLSEAHDDWTGLKGFITRDTISQYAHAILDKCEVFLCGPPVMMEKVIRALRRLGIEDHRIHHEHFTI